MCVLYVYFVYMVCGYIITRLELNKYIKLKIVLNDVCVCVLFLIIAHSLEPNTGNARFQEQNHTLTHTHANITHTYIYTHPVSNHTI